MALIFILHVIGIGILLNWLPIRFITVLGTFAYFVVFYLLCGHFLASHRQMITPQMPLEDDWYRYQKPKKKSLFGPLEYEGTKADDEEATEEQERKARQEKERLKPENHPSTKP